MRRVRKTRLFAVCALCVVKLLTIIFFTRKRHDSTDGGMYENTAKTLWATFESHLEGSFEGVVVILSKTALGADAHRALRNSAEKLGFGERACIFCTLSGAEEAAELSRDELFDIVEGLDPLALVAADSESIRALSEAYRTDIPPLARTRVFGRSTVAFKQFESMLEDPQDKQRAWALLKKLVL